MSFGVVNTAVLLGLETHFVQVEADVHEGLPFLHMVGYLSAEVKEAAVRIRAAMKNAGVPLPPKKMIINLSPVHLRKRGASFDLPIALSLLIALGLLPPQKMKQTLVLGELSLDGRIARVSGVLPIVLFAKEQGFTSFILPVSNAMEAALVPDILVFGASHLKEVIAHLKEQKRMEPTLYVKHQDCMENESIDFSDIAGQASVKRATEIAVAGNHNLLYIGSPGAGKTMLGKRIPTIMPPMDMEESIEVTKVYSIIGKLDEEYPLIRKRPFRFAQSNMTRATILGGGASPKPGEISLASGGVLFLDELPLFGKGVLEGLLNPLEEQRVRIVRQSGNYVFPANTMVIGAMNCCPCGHYPDLNRCTCSSSQIMAYYGKLSRPLVDRIDICAMVSKVPYDVLIKKEGEETSKKIRRRIIDARNIQKMRFKDKDYMTNAEITAKDLSSFCTLDSTQEEMMATAYDRLGLSARSYHKVLKVARTIADLDASENIQTHHLGEALGYRLSHLGGGEKAYG